MTSIFINPSMRETLIEQWVMFKETTLFSSALAWIIEFVRTHTEGLQNAGKKIYDINFNDFLFEYPSESALLEDKKLFDSVSLENSPKIQLPRYRGRFEYEGRNFMIVGAGEELEGETNEYLYKWMVVDVKKLIDIAKTRTDIRLWIKGVLES